MLIPFLLIICKRQNKGDLKWYRQRTKIIIKCWGIQEAEVTWTIEVLFFDSPDGQCIQRLESRRTAVKTVVYMHYVFIWGNTEKWGWKHKDQCVADTICLSPILLNSGYLLDDFLYRFLSRLLFDFQAQKPYNVQQI